MVDAIIMDEKSRNNKWSIEEKSFLKEYSQKLRKDGESENSFWNNCAIAMNNMFGGKKQNRFQLSKRSCRAYIDFFIERKYRSQKDFCDLAEFKLHELIDELLEQQPLLADVLLAVSLPTSKIGNTKSVQRLKLVISTVFGMLMYTGLQELSLQLVSS
ncbi:hypothetical protein DPMN_108784 [Dreissena polymorpha]|uniref:Uncharacterized protein n=1 Tax=Dreissena polymorpha TaxID=45954 RepID=A0A9D4QLC7_DREPO|nr:hypothetical protein DPMN_108784 [Dreissena polymorpha]